jgi:hypothetical protein
VFHQEFFVCFCNFCSLLNEVNTFVSMRVKLVHSLMSDLVSFCSELKIVHLFMWESWDDSLERFRYSSSLFLGVTVQNLELLLTLCVRVIHRVATVLVARVVIGRLLNFIIILDHDLTERWKFLFFISAFSDSGKFFAEFVRSQFWKSFDNKGSKSKASCAELHPESQRSASEEHSEPWVVGNCKLEVQLT